MAVEATYDYIVVGAGAAGCVIAGRLAEATDHTVLLLEAGGSDDLPAVHATDVPTTTGMWGDPAVSWPYLTVPQPACHGRSIPLPQGRVLGGGSSINAMMYVRGNRRDFDHWRDLGNDGWGYADVVPYFAAAETYARGGNAWRGDSGPLHVIDYPDPSVVSTAFAAAANELGFGDPRIPTEDWDYNGERQEGSPFYYQSTRSAPDRRCSSADAFLTPVAGAPNLTVATGADATRVLLDGDRAVGVEYVQDGVTHRAGAAAEVVVSAGAIQSPRLLMLSGLGPAGHLRDRGITPLVDLPGVGQNLQDHLLFGVAYASLVDLPFPQLLAEAGLFLRTAVADQGSGPDLQFFFGPVLFVDDRYRVPGPAFTFAPILVQPRSRGTVTLDPAGAPVIDPHYLSHPADVDLLVEGITMSRRLAHAAAYDGLRGREIAPGDEVTDRAGLVDYVRQSASTVWHPAGTCRMGPDPSRDPGAVVDPQLRVHGVAGLRVADASVMPTITTGNTSAASIMIGCRAADLLSGGLTGGPTAGAARRTSASHSSAQTA